MKAVRLFYRGGWVLLLGLALGTQAQQAAPARNLLLKFTPQYVVVSGYWLELEQRWKQHPRQSVTITPQFYAGPTGNPNASGSNPFDPVRHNSDEKVLGAGLQLQHRWYLTEPKATYPSGFYVSYGPSVQHFSVSHNGLGWVEVVGPTGLPYYEYRNSRHTETITRYGGSVQTGYQVPLSSGRVFLDIYAGAGWRESRSRKESKPTTSRYNAGTSDYGHQGFYFPAGFKIGVALR